MIFKWIMWKMIQRCVHKTGVTPMMSIHGKVQQIKYNQHRQDAHFPKNPLYKDGKILNKILSPSEGCSFSKRNIIYKKLKFSGDRLSNVGPSSSWWATCPGKNNCDHCGYCVNQTRRAQSWPEAPSTRSRGPTGPKNSSVSYSLIYHSGDGVRRVPRGKFDQLGRFKLVPQLQSWNGYFVIIAIVIIVIIVIVIIITTITTGANGDDGFRDRCLSQQRSQSSPGAL